MTKKNMYTEINKDSFPSDLTLELGDQKIIFKKQTWDIQGEVNGLRYGENPDQPAALYKITSSQVEIDGVRFRDENDGLVSALTEEHMLQAGKHPGKTNLTDIDNGLNILQYLGKKPACLILKHNNPCGAAWTDDGVEHALSLAFEADRIAAFGGAIVCNRTVNKAFADIVNSSYFEVIAAPDYDQDALDELKKKKNIRIIKIPGILELDKLVGQPFLDIKSLMDGGIIIQHSFRNRILTAEDFLPAAAEHDGTSYNARKPSKKEADDLLFAWAIEAGVSSNSVLFVKDGVTKAIGTGEQDRVGCVQLAIYKAHTKYADLLASKELGLSLFELKLKTKTDPSLLPILEKIEAKTKEDRAGLIGSVVVSDGFFPFRDGVDLCIEQGVSAIAQPGGSMRDYEVIQAVNEASPQVAMVFTGQRSFKH